MQALKSISDISKHRDYLGLHFGHKWFMHFECASGFSRLCHAFLVLSHDVAHIDDLFFLKDA
jgi:hypothetical protein